MLQTYEIQVGEQEVVGCACCAHLLCLSSPSHSVKSLRVPDALLLDGVAQVGVIRFSSATSIALDVPLTPNVSSALEVLSGLDNSNSGETQTAEALEIYLNESSRRGRAGASRLVVLITDDLPDDVPAALSVVRHREFTEAGHLMGCVARHARGGSL